MSTRFRTLLALILLAPSAGAAAGQLAPGPDAVLPPRATSGFTLMMPLTPGDLSRGIPGLRLTQTWSLTPGFAIQGSLLQVGGEDAILQGGGAGVRLSRSIGPLRVHPALELVFGRAVVDAGGWYVGVDWEREYRPWRLVADDPAAGAGATLGLEWLHRSGFGAEILAGWWRLVTPERGSALMLGGGVRWGLADDVWFWRTSGHDDAPPRIAVSSDPRHPVLALDVADRSGIERVTIDGVPARLLPPRPGAAEVPGYTVVARAVSVRVPIAHGMHDVEIESVDGAGNRATTTVTLNGAYGVPPALGVSVPDTVHTAWVDVRGSVSTFDEAPRVVVDGCVAPTTAGDTDGASRFDWRVPLRPGMNAIATVVSDRFGGENAHTRDVVYMPGATATPSDAAELRTRVSRTASGLTLRVHGTASDGAGIGIHDVRVGDASAALGFLVPQRVRAEFLAFVPVGDDASIVARTVDGREATAALHAPQPATSRPRGVALLIGIDEFASAGIADRTDAASSAEAVAAVLHARGAADFGEIRILTDGAATRDGIARALDWLGTAANDADVVVVYWAGRASPAARGEARALLASDARASYGPGELEWDALERRLRSIAAEVVVFTDLRDVDDTILVPAATLACGVQRIPRGGLAVVAAPSDSLMSALNGAPDRIGATTLGELIDALGPTALRTTGPVFDPALPLVELRP